MNIKSSLLAILLFFSAGAYAQTTSAPVLPVLSLCGHTDKDISIDLLFDCSMLQINDGKDSTAKVLGYAVTFVPVSNNEVRYTRVTGGRFHNTNKGKPEEMEPGTTIKFSDVTVLINGRKYLMDGPQYIVVE